MQYMRAVLTPENRVFARRASRLAVKVGWVMVGVIVTGMLLLYLRYGVL
jgi:hypothetical protein